MQLFTPKAARLSSRRMRMLLRVMMAQYVLHAAYTVSAYTVSAA